MQRRLWRRLILITTALLLTLCVGTIGFRFIEGYPLFDAFYMTLITITTVGYQEIHPLSHTGRVFNSFLILFGVSAMFFVLGAVTQSIIEFELQDHYGKRRKQRMIAQLQDHVIVCGFGRVGRNASCELQRGKVPFVVIDRNPQRIDRASAAGMLTLLADATRDECMREAGVARARGLIAALPSDAENLFIILSAKNLNPRLTIATRASEEEAEQKLRRAGADTVFAPYTMAGHRLAHALLRPHVVEFLEFATGALAPKVRMEQVRVAENTACVNKSLAEMPHAGDLRIVVLAIRRPDSDMMFNPGPETKLRAGDYLIVLGEQPDLERLEKTLA
jgi:voltage-gated potassium channel